MNPVLGIVLIAIGSVGAASFYVPFKKVQKWSWESYWISHGVTAWLIMPWIFAFFTVPSGQLMGILSDAPSTAKWLAIIFGTMWGVGGLTFGLSLRFLGIALGQSVALGFCAAFGTLIPPMVAGVNLFATQAGILTLVGVSLTIAGIAIVGYAGALKNQKLSEEEKRKAIKDFALKKGIMIAILAGVMSAGMDYGFEAASPIEELAIARRVNPLFASNPSYKIRHVEIWPELEKLIRESGVYDYAIYLDEETNILFACQKQSGESSSQDLGSNPVVHKWWAYMADIMETNPDNSPLTTPLEEVFYMS